MSCLERDKSFSIKKAMRMLNSESVLGYRERQFQNVQFCSRSRKAKILTTGIPGVFRGLKFEPDAEIGQNGTF